jgi:hypothetical protein
MRTLEQSAIHAVVAGHTTVDEVVRVLGLRGQY